MADLIKDGLYDKSQLERDGTQVENQFKGGKIAVWIGGPWTLGPSSAPTTTNWVPQPRARTSPWRPCRPARPAPTRSSAAPT